MRFLALLVALLCLPVAAGAQPRPEPTRAPTPAWVNVLTLPAPDPARRERATQTLLVSNQSRYEADRHEHYTRIASLVQNPQGLQALGSITLAWRPEQSDLIVHDVRILRGSTVVDLLARGQTFMVLRRENNLEMATLDGVLTAAMQVEGLSVGDVLDVSYTVRQRAGLLPLRAENAVFVGPEAATRRLHVRETWPAALRMRWRGTGVFERASLRPTATGTEIIFDAQDVAGVTPPVMAPARFSLPASLETTSFGDWGEISRLVAPFYERAAALPAGSPLRAEIARIAAATSDPAARAMAALRLVQDQVRYVALVMGDGNYLPATAEQTWSRRYGDCKAKSVLLMTLLRGLGVEAEPVPVNLGAADGLDGRLPQMRQFNHVIVRARIAGRSYWLDGARTGDRLLEDLALSPLQWALPVRAAGAALEPIPFGPPSRPLVESRLTHDASGGLLSPVTMTNETTFRGELAGAMRAAIAQQGVQALAQMEREFTSSTGSSDVQLTHGYDDDAGEFTIRLTGTRVMDWSAPNGRRRVVFAFNNDLLNWQPPTPPDKENRSAPLLLTAIPYAAAVETIILPFEGVGFTLAGGDIDRTVAGARLRRTLRLEGARATSRTEFQLMQREIPLEEIAASEDQRQEIFRNVASVGGASNRLTDSDRRALRGRD